ncbi:MAG: glycosyltransferase family 39 protein [Ginsengibacter sp.]
MGFLKKHHLVLFFAAWTVLNLLQSFYTVLLNDEAYYWVYSRFLAWGYFDHPPMIALLIKAGYSLIHNELGVRLFIVLLNTLTLVIIYNLLPRKNDKLFYSIAGSIALLQLGGFIAVPDIPLVFFVALFFLCYKKFIEYRGWKDAILLGVVMALMLYSKYHGVLVIVFTLASNIALVKNKKAWTAVLIALILFVPHLYWQYQHQFPSVQYHLFERSSGRFDPIHPLEFIGSQLLLAGPLVGWLFLWCSIKYRTKNLFEKALQYSMTGIYLFFLVSSFRGEGEGNWTVAALVPLIILNHQYMYGKPKLQRLLLTTLPVTLLLVLAARIYLVSPVKPIKSLNTNEFEQNSAWAQKIKEASGGLPVVFISSYQKAAKYWFYGGIPAFSLNTPFYRRNNYNFWPLEQSIQQKKVYAMYRYDPAVFPDSIQTTAGILRGKIIDKFFSFSGLLLNITSPLQFDANHKISGKIKIMNTPTVFLQNDSVPQIVLQLFKNDGEVGSYDLRVMRNLTNQSILDAVTINEVVLPPGSYEAKLGIETCIPGYYSLNSTTIKISIP